MLGLQVDIDCDAADVCALVSTNYSAFVTAAAPAAVPDLIYRVRRDTTGFRLQRVDAEPVYGWDGLDTSELIFLLEKELTIEAQKRHPELYFLHAAALLHGDEAFLLIGSSGNGKSTTCWGLLHHGCSYLSDELAPIDLEGYSVQPYPHALCMKSEPPMPYPLPDATLRTEATLHIPVERLPCPIVRLPVPVRRIFHVEHRGMGLEPSVTKLGTAEAGMLIYANALNPLSHARDGLDAALDIAQHCQSYRLITGSLDASVAVILDTLDR